VRYSVATAAALCPATVKYPESERERAREIKERTRDRGELVSGADNVDAVTFILSDIFYKEVSLYIIV
jgi:hypothetical protein